MRFRWVLRVAVVATLAMPAWSQASVVFSSILNGDNERPGPVDGTGAGSATAMLSGTSSSYVLSYTLNYADLSASPVGGHIHYSILPPGRDPVEQTGPVVHDLETDFNALSNEGSITGEWRFDDAAAPLTDALADSLMDGELYFNLHTANHPDGEIRGQLRPVGGEPDTSAPANATAIPLPPALVAGVAGLAAAGWAARRRASVAR